MKLNEKQTTTNKKQEKKSVTKLDHLEVVHRKTLEQQWARRIKKS